MLDCPVRISDTSAENVNPDEIYRVMVLNKVATFVHKLTEDDYRKIINMML
jgi:hypothetical protein